jgi:hypothetical protein
VTKQQQAKLTVGQTVLHQQHQTHKLVLISKEHVKQPVQLMKHQSVEVVLSGQTNVAYQIVFLGALELVQNNQLKLQHVMQQVVARVFQLQLAVYQLKMLQRSLPSS